MRHRPITSTTGASDTPRRERVRVVDRIGRVLLSVVIVFAVIYGLQIIQEMRSTDQRRMDAANRRPPRANAEDALANMLVGNWQFAGVPWQVSATEMTQDEALQALSRSVVPPLGGPSIAPGQAQQSQLSSKDRAAHSSTTSTVPATEDFAFTFLEMMRPEVSETVDHVVYRVHRTGVEGIAFAGLGTPRRIERVRAAIQADGERWQFVELDRRTNDNEESAVGGEGLLPVPRGYFKMASRRDLQGRLVAELIAPQLANQNESSVDSVGQGQSGSFQEPWIRAGWKITSQLQSQGLQIDDRKTGLGRVNSFELAPNVAEDVLVCTRGDESRMVIVSNLADDSRHRTLWIMRMPD